MLGLEAAAHLVKRVNFRIEPTLVEQVAQMDREQAVQLLVDQADPPAVGSITFRNVYQQSEYDDFNDLLRYETRRLASPASGLGDRVLWFWHGLLTTGFSKIELPALLLRQHQMMAGHTLGSYRQMMYDLTIDAGMLFYLDGWGSRADNPNENYAREVMELFTLGRGLYSQADVRSAAKAFAGWYIEGFPEKEGEHFDPRRIRSAFDPDAAYKGKLDFLGKTIELDGGPEQYKLIIDRILELEPKPGFFPCAEYIATRFYQYFVHWDEDPASIARLAGVFRNNQYQIRPLLSALFRNRFFDSSRQDRGRFPIEVFHAVAGTLAATVDTFDYAAYFDATGQMPFDPPNVAGWPVTRPANKRWLSASHTLARTRLGLVAYDLPPRNEAVQAIAQAADPVGETLRRASLYEISETTRRVLEQAAQLPSPQTRARTLLALAVASPEFALT